MILCLRCGERFATPTAKEKHRRGDHCLFGHELADAGLGRTSNHLITDNLRGRKGRAIFDLGLMEMNEVRRLRPP